MAMKKVNCTLSVVCCVSLVSMAIVMFVLYAQLLGEYQQLQHQYASISSQLNQTHDNKMAGDHKIELTNLTATSSDSISQLQQLFSNELNKSNKMIAELKTQLTSLKATSSNAISQLQQQDIRFSNELNQSNKTITDQKIELTNLTANLNDELDKSNKTIAQLKADLTSHNDELDKSNKKIAELEADLTNHNDELNQSNKMIAELKTQLTSLKATSSDAISQLQQQNIRFSNGLNQSNKRIDELKIELTNLNETQELLKKSFSRGQSCQEILANGQTRNGVYTITGTGTPFDAYCNMDRGGYMVFQRRFDGSTDFNQNFQTYVNGFGSVTGEYWLGLEKLYQFTKMGKHKIRVDLVAYDGNTTYAIYEDFSVGVGPGYQLHIGKYSGTAGDGLTYHNNMKFSTADNDADAHSGRNCAEYWKGAFWYNSCHHVNINAINYNEKRVHRGMEWRRFKGTNPMKETTMMVL